MRTKLTSWLRAGTQPDEHSLGGQSMVEYALILVFVTVVCVASVALVGDEVIALWDQIEIFIGGALSQV